MQAKGLCHWWLVPAVNYVDPANANAPKASFLSSPSTLTPVMSRLRPPPQRPGATSCFSLFLKTSSRKLAQCLPRRLSASSGCWRRRPSRTGPSHTGSASGPTTRSATTLRGVTGAAPSWASKLLSHSSCSSDGCCHVGHQHGLGWLLVVLLTLRSSSVTNSLYCGYLTRSSTRIS